MFPALHATAFRFHDAGALRIFYPFAPRLRSLTDGLTFLLELVWRHTFVVEGTALASETIMRVIPCSGGAALSAMPLQGFQRLRVRGAAGLRALVRRGWPWLCACSWSTLAIADSSPTLRLVSDVWPPFTDVAGKPREALDLVESGLLRSGVHSDFTIMSWSVAREQLERRQFDGSAAIWRDPAREKYLLYSKPYLENRLVLVTRKGGDASATSLVQLANERLALTRGYAYGDAITQAARVRLVYLASDADCLRAVLEGRADYLLLDELMVHHLFAFYADKAQKLLVAGKVPLVRRSLHLALDAKYPGARALLAQFDRNVERMIADGTYNRLLHVPWVVSDVNGDGRAEYVGSTQLTPSDAGDPNSARAGYPVFTDAAVGSVSAQRAPGYMIDGKSYDTWGDASANLGRADASSKKDIYKYSTGFVLGEF